MKPFRIIPTIYGANRTDSIEIWSGDLSPDGLPPDSPRAAILAEARTWLGTPWHHQGRVKGKGVDCGMFLLEVYQALRYIPRVEPGNYPADWFLHRSEALFLRWVEQYARPVTTPEPGDLAVWKLARTYAHGAIVVAWPLIIHAYQPWKQVVISPVGQCPDLAPAPVRFYTVLP